jgi:hypothetical protein
VPDLLIIVAKETMIHSGPGEADENDDKHKSVVPTHWKRATHFLHIREIKDQLRRMDVSSKASTLSSTVGRQAERQYQDSNLTLDTTLESIILHNHNKF